VEEREREGKRGGRCREERVLGGGDREPKYEWGDGVGGLKVRVERGNTRRKREGEKREEGAWGRRGGAWG